MKDLKTVLNECKKYAKSGYKIASNNEKSLNRALSAAEEKIRSTLLEFNSSSCYSPETTALLEGQLSDIEQSFIKLSFAFKDDLENLHSNCRVSTEQEEQQNSYRFRSHTIPTLSTKRKNGLLPEFLPMKEFQVLRQKSVQNLTA